MNTVPNIDVKSATRFGGDIRPRKIPTRAVAIEAARQSEWLAAQPPDLADALLSQAVLRSFRKGQVILGIDEADAGLHFLVQGTVDLWIPRSGGDLIPVHLLTPSQWFGELGALTSRRGLVEYSGRSNGSSLVIPQFAIAVLRAKRPDFGQASLDLLGNSVKCLAEIAGDHAGLSPESRVISKLVTLSAQGAGLGERPVHALPISQEELAAMCCVSRQTVNSLLRRLSQRGILRVSYRQISVLSRGALLTLLSV